MWSVPFNHRRIHANWATRLTTKRGLQKFQLLLTSNVVPGAEKGEKGATDAGDSRVVTLCLGPKEVLEFQRRVDNIQHRGCADKGGEGAFGIAHQVVGMALGYQASRLSNLIGVCRPSLHLAGRLGEVKPRMKLLPVRVSECLPAPVSVEHGSSELLKAQTGTIYIELRQAQVRIEGSAEPGLVRVLLECLRA